MKCGESETKLVDFVAVHRRAPSVGRAAPPGVRRPSGRVGAGAGLTLLPPLRGDASASPPDPVPLRRVWLSPDKLALGTGTAPNKASWSSCRATNSRPSSGARRWRSRLGRRHPGWSRLITTPSWSRRPGRLLSVEGGSHGGRARPAPVDPAQPAPARAALRERRRTHRRFRRQGAVLACRDYRRSFGVGRLVGPRGSAAGGADAAGRVAIRPAVPGQPRGRAGVGPARRPNPVGGRRRPFRAAAFRDAERQPLDGGLRRPLTGVLAPPARRPARRPPRQPADHADSLAGRPGCDLRLHDPVAASGRPRVGV